jgi:peptidoglycan hydrolase-like protein with peptidoglycan-binding domain
MAIFSVAASMPLLPDPDETSPAKATIDPSDVLTLERTLDPWAKVSLTRAGAALRGWVVASYLIPIQEQTVKLFDEPLGDESGEATGRVDIIATVQTWAKVRVTRADGTSVVGWTEDAAKSPVTPPQPPGPSPAPGPVSPPQPVADDLVLGANERYRAALLQAKAITRIDAAAIAALIDAEAARIASGADAGAWDPKSSAGASSSARGLTQFLSSTWCDMACRPGTLLNSTARQSGYVTNDNKIVASMTNALLDLRFDPTQSIVAAAEYGFANLAALVGDQLVQPDIGDDDRAWYIYLAHHEGLEGARHFLRNDQAVDISRLIAQVGPVRAVQCVSAAGGDVTVAYRTWLNDYMAQKIQPSRFRAKASGGVLAPGARALGQFRGAAIPIAVLGADRVDLVLEIQQALTNLGYLDPPPDGFMGPTSQWALAEFSRRNGLSTDGGFTKDIAAALLNPKALLPAIKPAGHWIDRILAYMIRKNYFVCRHPDSKNIVYVEGVDPDGNLNDEAPDAFNDLRIVISIGPDGTPSSQAWAATTDPGRDYTMQPLNPKGAAQIAFNQFKSWHVGTHVGPTGFDPHEALVQAAPVDIYRDTNKDFKRDGPIYTGMFGIDQHWGYDQQKVGKASAGCLVGEMRKEHRAFMALIKTDPRYQANNGYKFVTTIIRGAEALGP